MSGSYEKINYSLRPAKTIERKMLGDTFRRLTPFGKVETYRYIGFGSTYFSDFVLFHKSLGINNMISIERDVENEKRFLFNRPFSCVEIKFGESSEILPTLDWNARTILWLDYDGRLSGVVLSDVKFFCANAPPGSLIVVTVNAEPARFEYLHDIPEERLKQLKKHVGGEKVPEDIDGKQLAGRGTSVIYRRIIKNEILETLNARNGGLDSGSKISYKQLFNFHYADDAKMLTVGGLLYDEGQENLVAQCAFENLSFVRTNEKAYSIEVPNLTYKEIRHLSEQLPVNNPSKLRAHAIPPKDLERYAKVYRYFPTFIETEI